MVKMLVDKLCRRMLDPIALPPQLRHRKHIPKAHKKTNPAHLPSYLPTSFTTPSRHIKARKENTTERIPYTHIKK